MSLCFVLNHIWFSVIYIYSSFESFHSFFHPGFAYLLLVGKWVDGQDNPVQLFSVPSLYASWLKDRNVREMRFFCVSAEPRIVWLEQNNHIISDW